MAHLARGTTMVIKTVVCVGGLLVPAGVVMVESLAFAIVKQLPPFVNFQHFRLWTILAAIVFGLWFVLWKNNQIQGEEAAAFCYAIAVISSALAAVVGLFVGIIALIFEGVSWIYLTLVGDYLYLSPWAIWVWPLIFLNGLTLGILLVILLHRVSVPNDDYLC